MSMPCAPLHHPAARAFAAPSLPVPQITGSFPARPKAGNSNHVVGLLRGVPKGVK